MPHVPSLQLECWEPYPQAEKKLDKMIQAAQEQQPGSSER